MIQSSSRYIATGPATPPSMPTSGLTARCNGFSAPPDNVDSVISLAAMPKKRHMNIPLMMKCNVSGCPNT